MKIGYVRVSKDDQNPDLQLTALKQAGCKQIFTDTANRELSHWLAFNTESYE